MNQTDEFSEFVSLLTARDHEHWAIRTAVRAIVRMMRLSEPEVAEVMQSRPSVKPIGAAAERVIEETTAAAAAEPETRGKSNRDPMFAFDGATYSEFLSRLPVSCPLAKATIDGFVQRALLSPPAEIDRIAREYHDMAREAVAMCAEAKIHQNEGIIAECVEQNVLARIVPHVLGVAESEEDRDLSARVAALGGVSVRALGGKTASSDAVYGEIDWAEAARRLAAVDDCVTAREKLVCLCDACATVFDGLAAAAASSGRSNGADDFIPSLVYAVLRARPRRLATNLAFIDKFRPQRLLDSSVTGYFFVSLSVAVAFIQNVEPSQLSIDPMIFRERLRVPSVLASVTRSRLPVTPAVAEHWRGSLPLFVSAALEPLQKQQGDEASRWIMVGEGGCPRYDSRLRAALSHMTKRRFGAESPLALVEQEMVVQAKSVIARGGPEQRMSAAPSGRSWWALKVGIAAIVGGGVFAVTGGIAAPAIAWLGFGSYLSTVAAATGLSGAAILSAALGLVGATVTSSSVASRTSPKAAAVTELFVHWVRQVPSLHSVVLVPGWLPGSASGEIPEVLCGALGGELERASGPYGDLGVLLWEPRLLAKFGTALADALRPPDQRRGTSLWPLAKDPLSAVVAPWHELEAKIENSSKLFAEGLVGSEIAGARPVTLIGIGLGAAVIFRCLERLAEADIDQYRGLVQNVVLVSAAVPARCSDRWRKVRDVVPGRLINCFSHRDPVLRAIFGVPIESPRAHFSSADVAGLVPVCQSPSEAFVENFDLSAVPEASFASCADLENPGVLNSIIRTVKVF